MQQEGRAGLPAAIERSTLQLEHHMSVSSASRCSLATCGTRSDIRVNFLTRLKNNSQGCACGCEHSCAMLGSALVHCVPNESRYAAMHCMSLAHQLVRGSKGSQTI